MACGVKRNSSIGGSFSIIQPNIKMIFNFSKRKFYQFHYSSYLANNSAQGKHWKVHGN